MVAQKQETTAHQSQDFSQFTLNPPVNEEEKEIVFPPSIASDNTRNPFTQHFISNPLWIGVYVVLIWIAIVSGVYLFRAGSCTEKDTQAVPALLNQGDLPTPTPPAMPVDISPFSITVLNGTDVADKAEQMKSILEEGGFMIAKTGGAERHDYEETVVYVKKNVPEQVIEELHRFIGAFLVVIDETYPNEDADIVVIVGKS